MPFNQRIFTVNGDAWVSGVIMHDFGEGGLLCPRYLVRLASGDTVWRSSDQMRDPEEHADAIEAQAILVE